MTNDQDKNEIVGDKDDKGGARLPFAGKRLAREWALQSLYASRQAGETTEEMWPRLLEMTGEELEIPGGGHRRFARKLARQVIEQASELDEAIKPSLNNWRLERLTIVDLMILRLALVEISHHASTPHKVILNEYIEIAKDFGSPESPKFINGVLDDLARRVREQPDDQPLVPALKDPALKVVEEDNATPPA